jgi:hypothetical protein
MTPQSNFMILATVTPSRCAELRSLLAEMNREPGVLNPANALIPFEQFDRVHFARLLILDDQTLDDIKVYGLPRVDMPTYLAFLGDVDGPREEFFAELVQRAGDGLRSIFMLCEGFTPGTDLLAWITAHNVAPAANYVNWIGRTVRQVREEIALRKALVKFVQDNPDSLRGMQIATIRDTLKTFVAGEVQAGRLTLTPPSPTPLGWKVRNLLNLVGIPILFLIVSPLLLVALPFVLIRLRIAEKSDPEVAPRVNADHASLLGSLEDHDVSNQFSAMGSIKPGWFRRMVIILVLIVIDYTAKHIFNRGRLARVISIQFARWVFLDGKKRVIFTSNYDGSLESYMDDFINKVAFGLNVVFSNGIGYPRTNWLLLDGAKDEQTFKNYLRRHQLPTEVWYNAFPGITALDKWRNALIREGIEKSWMTNDEIQEWLRLI